MNKKITLAFIAIVFLISFQKLSAQNEPAQEKKIKFTLPKGAVIKESKQIIIPDQTETSIPLPPPIGKKSVSNPVIDSVILENAISTDIIDKPDSDEENQYEEVYDLESLKKICDLKPLNIYAIRISAETHKSFPEEIFNFKNLRLLEIYGQDKMFIPEKIFELSNLKKLQINQVAELPDSLFLIKNLEDLTLGNGTPELDERIGNLTNLKKLSVRARIIPTSFHNLKNLEELEISINGDMPINDEKILDNIGYLENLKKLSISNRIINLPLTFKNLTKLENLEIVLNKSVTLNDVFANMSNLKRVSLDSS
ncbi:MAG: leucine-rich repeat domain-containing protein, partial [Pseudarcicella sp.]|nr:leucine-rich repeat domain-containing protein [Pseudarcicella sp.]